MTDITDDSEWSAGEAFGKLILRLTLGGFMLFHGAAKIMNPGSIDWVKSQVVAMGLPDAVAYGVYAGEILAPILIIFGIFSRIGGLMIAVNMVFAFVLVHMGELFALGQSGGWALELQGFFLFCGLAVMFMGSGRYAVRPD